MKKIIYTPAAIRSLKQLEKYLEENFGKQFSKNTLKRLTGEIRDLELFPEMGSFVKDRYPVDTDYQFFYFRKNYVFYRVAGNEVRIIDVLDERADFMKILFGIDTTPPETLDYWKE